MKAALRAFALCSVALGAEVTLDGQIAALKLRDGRR